MLLSVACLPRDSLLREGGRSGSAVGAPWCSQVVEGCEFPNQTRRPQHGVGWCEGGSPENTITCPPRPLLPKENPGAP